MTWEAYEMPYESWCVAHPDDDTGDAIMIPRWWDNGQIIAELIAEKLNMRAVTPFKPNEDKK